MLISPPERDARLLQLIEARVRQTTHGRVRDLSVEQEDGTVILRGRVPSWHARQLALHAALELMPDDGLRDCITVN